MFILKVIKSGKMKKFKCTAELDFAKKQNSAGRCLVCQKICLTTVNR